MEKFKINIFTMGGGCKLEIDLNNHESIEFLKIFNHEMKDDVDTIEMEVSFIQKKNILMIEQLNAFIEKQPKKVPGLEKFRALINKLNDDEQFKIMFNTEELTQNEIDQIYTEIEELNGCSSTKTEEYEKIREKFVMILNNYSLRTFNEEEKTKLGEPNKDIRKCRFCFKGKKEGATFKSEAHAISEALGNKMLIQFEECDECNSYFDENIERHLIKYLDLYRTFFNVKNKANKVPTIKGGNFEYRKVDEKTLLIKQQLSDDENIDDYDISNGISLKFHEKINYQKIYKTLVKFAIGIMEPEDLHSFKQTIDWLKGDYYIEKLPKIGILADYRLYTEHPKMAVYVRKNENSVMPIALGEFRFTFLTFVFVIPTFDQNEKDFTDEENYNSIWKLFNHFNVSGNMRFDDFSESIERELQMNLIFDQDHKN